MENLIEQVLLQDHAKRLVNAALAHQELLVATFANSSKDFFSIVVTVDPVDIHPGSHDVADPAIPDIENPLHHLLLRILAGAHLHDWQRSVTSALLGSAMIPRRFP